MNLSQQIREWYRSNRRDLPWRNTTNPYRIWISEIVLQQTRVQQGLEYYLRFVEAFPDVNTLAAASEDEVFALWEGLGYYSRARNLRKGAQFIAQNGMPASYQEWLNVPGVGPYTAAAISSFAHGEGQAVVDGNVYRVLSRIFAIDTPINSSAGQKEFRQIAQELIAHQPPGEHNQAMMELGALVCVPKSPKCEECPVMESCSALRSKTIEEYPVKTSKTKVLEETLHYTVIYSHRGVAVRKRPSKGIWASLYEFTPQAPENLNLQLTNIREFPEVKHLLSHRKLSIRIHAAELLEESTALSEFEWKSWDELDQIAFPRPLRKWLVDNLLPLRLGSN